MDQWVLFWQIHTVHNTPWLFAVSHLSPSLSCPILLLAFTFWGDFRVYVLLMSILHYLINHTLFHRQSQAVLSWSPALYYEYKDICDYHWIQGYLWVNTGHAAVFSVRRQLSATTTSVTVNIMLKTKTKQKTLFFCMNTIARKSLQANQKNTHARHYFLLLLPST